jgi:IS5 family transposase
VRPLFLARRVLDQERRHCGRKVYSLHAPEVECIGKARRTGRTSSASR